MSKAIIIGPTSGIGRALAKVLAENGYSLGLAGRRVELLESLQKEIKTETHIRKIDVSKPEEAVKLLDELIRETGGMDLIVISSGTGFINKDLVWEQEKAAIDVNVTGFTAIAGAAMDYFCRQGRGHIAGISSIAGLRGGAEAPAYNASKAYISNYLQGLRQKAGKLKLPITVTDIKPGLVDTAMAKGDNLFWVASSEKAATQIYRAIKNRRKHAYITKRWRLVAWLLRIMPDWVYNRI
ncbi:MAG: SDR family NAD(P)-dependent oxidoreductase [Planctomycetes bacterium]|nr:SDR family NAD(P)-dependent oxidoreductase [Planctomycetota bacterium]